MGKPGPIDNGVGLKVVGLTDPLDNQRGKTNGLYKCGVGSEKQTKQASGRVHQISRMTLATGVSGSPSYTKVLIGLGR